MYKVKKANYNHTYKVIGKHPDGRILAVRFGNVNGLYVVDRDLSLIDTLNTTLLNTDANGINNGITHAVVLNTGTMLCWGMYRTNLNETVIWRSTDTTYSNFEPVLTLPNYNTFIERSVDVSTLDDTVMACDYTMNPPDPITGEWTAPAQQYIHRGTNDGRDWGIVHTRNRIDNGDGDYTIRHFHAAQYDPYENIFWLTTGDWYGETSIATINPDGTGYTRIVQANPANSGQQERTTALMFTENYVYYGSDSFYQQDHYVSRIDRQTREVELLDFLPNDCIRVSDEIAHPAGEYLIMLKSWEKSPTNTGTSELYICDDYETGEWYELFSWDVASLDTVSVAYRIVNNEDGRLYIHSRRIIDKDGIARTATTTILDVEFDDGTTSTIEPDATVKLMADGRAFALPLYDETKLPTEAERMKVNIGNQVLCYWLEEVGKGSALKIKTDQGIRFINSL